MVLRRISRTIKTLLGLPERLKNLEHKLNELEAVQNIPQVIYIPSSYDFCALGNHIYPSPWFGTVPPACMRCGTGGFTYPDITFSSNSVMLDQSQAFVQ